MDYAFEAAGISSLVETALQTIRSGGSTICVGAPPIDQKFTIDPMLLFTSSAKKLCGCMMGNCNPLYDIPRLVRLWRSGQLDLRSMVTAIRPLEEINEAFADMQAGKGLRTVLKIRF